VLGGFFLGWGGVPAQARAAWAQGRGVSRGGASIRMYTRYYTYFLKCAVDVLQAFVCLLGRASAENRYVWGSNPSRRKKCCFHYWDSGKKFAPWPRHASFAGELRPPNLSTRPPVPARRARRGQEQREVSSTSAVTTPMHMPEGGWGGVLRRPTEPACRGGCVCGPCGKTHRSHPTPPLTRIQRERTVTYK